jgi:hypothetical protein
VTIEFSKDQPRAGAKKGSNGEIKPRQRERVTLAGPGPVLTRALTGATQAQPSPCILRPLSGAGKRSCQRFRSNPKRSFLVFCAGLQTRSGGHA